MSFYPLTLEQANLREVQGWRVGQHCQVKEWRGTYEIEGFHQYGDKKQFCTAYVAKLKKDGIKSKYGGDTSISNLLPLGAPQPTTDKNDLSAEEYAKQSFASGFGKSGWCMTDKEHLVKALSISKSGRVKVQDINVKKGITPRSQVVDWCKIYSKEDFLVNFAELEYELCGHETLTFVPRLFGGEWGFWHESRTLKEPTLKMTWLLD